MNSARMLTLALVLVLPLVGNASAALPAGLVAHYQLEDNVLDSSGKDQHGTEYGGATYADGAIGRAISLDGINDWIDLGNPLHWPTGTSARSMCGWAKTNTVAVGWRWIVAYGTAGISNAMFIGMDGDDLFGGGYGDDVQFNDFWDVGAWHHICLTYDGTTARLYADGTEVASAVKNWDLVSSRARIGRQVNNLAEFWEGQIDDVRIYDRVLSCGEISRLAGGGVGCSTIDFDDLPVGTVITDEYCGVTFSAPTGGEAFVEDMGVYGGTYSGTQALSTRPGVGVEFCPQLLRMVFDEPQEAVTFRVGPEGTVTVNAYDKPFGGTLISSQTVTIGDWMLPWEGVYTLVMVTSPAKDIRRIEIDGGGGLCETIDDLLFGVDNTPPIARVDSPSFHGCTCGIVEAMGEACDDDGAFGMYTLEYRPVSPADAPWTLINSSIYFVCGAGKLGEWDTSGLAHGYYYLRLTVTNACGLMSTATTVPYVDKQFDRLEINYPQNGSIVRGDSVCFDGTIWDNICFDSYVVEYTPAGAGLWQPVQPGASYTAWVWTNPFAHWDTTGLPYRPAGYDIRVTGLDQCGNTQTEFINNVIVDNVPPFAEIASPTPCAFVGHGSVLVEGAVSDNHAVSQWILDYTGGEPPTPSAHGWVTINSGTAAASGVLGKWDTASLPPCAYTLRLRVWDKARLNCTSPPHFGYDEYTVSVNVGPPGTNPDLNGDGCVDFEDLAILAKQWLQGCP